MIPSSDPDAGVTCSVQQDGDHILHFTNWPYPWRCSACGAVLYLGVWKYLEEPAPCPECDGLGYISRTSGGCETCEGKGSIVEERKS